MHILIFGTGGVGGYFGGRLAQAGYPVTFVARGQHLAALRTNGLTINSINGDIQLPHVNATDDLADIDAPDIILLTVKTGQVADAARILRPYVAPTTMIIPLQNGVESPRQLAQHISTTHILGGLCWIVSYIAAPGIIHHTGVEPHIAFGELDNRRTERVKQFAEMCRAAAIKKVDVPDDIQRAMWEKFTFIATMSGIGAVTRAPVGVTRTLPQTRAMIIQAIDEIIAVGQAHGIALTDDLRVRTLEFIDGMPAHSTMSMQRDIMEGCPSELEYQNGAVVRLGKEKQVPTPLHTFLLHALWPMELHARGLLPASANDDDNASQ